MSGETANQDQGPGQLRHPSANNRAASTSPNQGADRSFGEDEPTPTPEGPSIAFPIARPAVPHPPTVARAQGEEEEEVQKQVYVFQMSGMTPQEDPHEWGTATDVSGMPENVARLALAARRWRQKLADVRARNNNPDINAFQSWAVLLHVDQGRTSGFKRLLESGGATVLSTRPPHANFSEATHAFVDLKGKGVDQSLDVQALVEAGVWCLKSEYIADYLMQDPIPKPQNFVISEAVPYMTAREEASGGETPRKRKASSVSGMDGKRSKRL
uniref:TopBP1/SLF1 BRCT domain-containing protein n=1 Tax=Branchiostoma floridae TaxID=7739 RepID=C3Z1H3_BRAFL|eukprot:XP_002597579.1 hypothetical protein BRAFLDRAFT_123127 [Branchiostoma floridae]